MFRLAGCFVVLLLGQLAAGCNTGSLPSTEQDSKSKDEKSPIEKEKRTLQGRWIVIKAELGGKKFAPLEHVSFVFAGDTLKFTEWGDEPPPFWGEQVVTLRLDPAKNPKQIDFIPEKGGEKNKTQGIYQLAGDTLELCLPENEVVGTATKGKAGKPASVTIVVKERPKQFDSKQGFLLTLKRANNENSRRPATDAVPAPKQGPGADLRPDIGTFAGGRFVLLSNKSVQEELRFTDEQKAKLTTASATLKEKLLAELNKSQKQNLTPEERANKTLERGIVNSCGCGFH
jgi:uncharacterized protein (TIGR03067 family)